METAKKGYITSLLQKIKERKKSQDDPKLHALFFLPPSTQGHKNIFQIWQREGTSGAGLYIKRGIIL